MAMQETKFLDSRGGASQQVNEIDKSKPASEAEMAEPTEPANRVSEDRKEIGHGLYVYCIVPSDSPHEYGRIGVGTGSLVYAIPFKELAAVVSDFEGEGFDKTDANLLAHQRVVQKIFEKVKGIPVKFGTIRENEEDVRNVLEEGYSDFERELSELTSKEGTASALEPAAPTDAIGQILSQSAVSAARIEQMANVLDELKRMEHEKGADRLSEGIAKQLLELLAAVTSEQQKIREALGELRNLHTDNAASIGFQLGSLASGLENLKTLLTENAASLEKTVKGTIIEAIPPSVEQALAKQPSPVPSTARAPPASEVMLSEYTWCVNCGTAIGLIDRFCDHCGRPTTLR
jgi:hypothetical protein